MRDRDIAVTYIETTGPPEKVAAQFGAGSEYRVPITYTLETGARLETHRRFGLLRDAKAFVAACPAPPPRPLAACFDETGRFYATSETIRLGGSR